MRTRDAIGAALVFSLLTMVIFNFALDANTPEMRRLAAGFFWVAFAFSGTLALNRSFALEKESGAGRALIFAPVDPAGVYLGKFLANALFLLITQLIVLPAFIVFFDATVVASRWWALVASFLLGFGGLQRGGDSLLRGGIQYAHARAACCRSCFSPSPCPR